MNRLAIFLFYDPEGIVDDYISYYLSELKRMVKRLIVVVNGFVNESGYQTLRNATHEILIRENMGYDAGGFRDAMGNYVGWTKLAEYDEVVLCNDSVFGPLFPLEKVFGEMAVKAVDFWGMTRHKKMLEQLTEHIQSYFLAFRKSIISNACFRNFWEEIQVDGMSKERIILNYECRMTEYFAKHGFTWDTYVKELDMVTGEEAPPSPYLFYPYELIRKGFPFLKRYCFQNFSGLFDMRGELKAVMEFIECHTDYDSELIYRYLFRRKGVMTMKDSLGLNFIMSASRKDNGRKGSAIIIFRLNNEAFLDRSISFARRMMENDILLITEKEEILERLKNEKFSVRTNILKTNGTNIFKVLKNLYFTWKEYDYVCFADDIPCRTPIRTLDVYLIYDVWDNLIHSEGHVNQIIGILEKNRKIGYIASPLPIHYRGIEGLYKYDDSEWNKVQELLCRVGIDCKGEYWPESNTFWIRKNILEKILQKGFGTVDWEDKGFADRECFLMLPYFVYAQKFLAGMAETSEFAGRYQAQILELLQNVLGTISDGIPFESAQELYDGLSGSVRGLTRFCRSHQNIYLYGAGMTANTYIRWLERKKVRLQAIIVSNKSENPQSIEGIPVIALEDIKGEIDKVGIIVAVSPAWRAEIMQILSGRGYSVYCGGSE